MTPDRLPLASLAVFREAACRRSFKAAAMQIAVTPSSVSHRIRVLERQLGAPLFVRGVRSLALTPAGAALAASIDGAFNSIATAFAAAQNSCVEARLKVTALPLFTQTWLIPRLIRFEAAHPGIAIEIDTSNRVADFGRDAVDVAIRNAGEPGPGLVVQKLLDLRAVPLASAAVAATLRAPADLAQAVLIGISPRPDAWMTWLKAAGMPGLTPARHLMLDTVPAALEAAASGHGVALGLDPIVWDAQVASRLVLPFAPPVVSAGAYMLLHRREDGARHVVSAFADWLVAEMRADLPRLAGLRREAMAGGRTGSGSS